MVQCPFCWMVSIDFSRNYLKITFIFENLKTNIIRKNYFYRLLRAVIGSNLAALLAGKTPKVKPIVLEIKTVTNTVP